MGNNLTIIDLGSSYNVTSIHCGRDHVCALSVGQDIKCWGGNYNGQLGLGDTDNRGDSAESELSVIVSPKTFQPVGRLFVDC